MSGKSDLRHVNNVSHFEVLVDSCAAIGPALYKPTRINLKLESLQLTLQRAKVCLAAYEQSHVELKKAMEAQDHAFADFDTKIARLKEAFPTSDEHAAILFRKLMGAHAEVTGAPASKAAGTPETNLHHAVAHTTLQPVVDNLKALLKLLRAAPGYAPAAEDLGLDALDAWRCGLAAAVELVAQANATQDHARDERQEVLYTAQTGVVDLANDGKAYVKSLRGAPDAESKRIAKLDFH